jgi:hypothetical protein
VWIKVWDDDLGMDDKMGSCKIRLEELGLTATPLGTDRVIDNNLIRKDARIFLRLSWDA